MSSPADPAGTCEGFVSALSVQHAAICTLGPPFEVETVCFSDPVAARIDEMQIDLGEGPCWEARQTGAPVIVHDLHVAALAQWPVFRAAIATYPVRSVYAFPLTVGTLDVGAVVLYGSGADALSSEAIEHASTLADLAAVTVLRNALAHVDDRMGEGPHSRQIVHQATGMVTAQLRIPPVDALLVIRAHAFTTGRSVRDVAADIAARLIDFTV